MDASRDFLSDDEYEVLLGILDAPHGRLLDKWDL
jgi:hypothetical protein